MPLCKRRFRLQDELRRLTAQAPVVRARRLEAWLLAAGRFGANMPGSLQKALRLRVPIGRNSCWVVVRSKADQREHTHAEAALWQTMGLVGSPPKVESDRIMCLVRAEHEAPPWVVVPIRGSAPRGGSHRQQMCAVLKDALDQETIDHSIAVWCDAGRHAECKHGQ